MDVGLRRAGKQLAHDRQILVLPEHAEAGFEEERQRTVVVIGGELAVAGLERKRIDQLETARSERFECAAEQRPRDAATPARRAISPIVIRSGTRPLDLNPGSTVKVLP